MPKHTPKERAKRPGLISTILTRNEEIAKVFRETASVRPKTKRKVKAKTITKPTKTRFEDMSPEQISRELNKQRIKSQSKDVSRKRTVVAVAKGKIKKVVKKTRKKLRGFVEGKSKF